MTDNAISIEPTEPIAAKHLLDAHHALMQSLFPNDSCHYLDLEALTQPDILFFGARKASDLVGCGALALREDYGEIKSMYVDPEHRRNGIADAVLDRLMGEARAHKYSILRLETGDTLAAAHRLYLRNGFAFTGPFGGYPDLPESKFMEKQLD